MVLAGASVVACCLAPLSMIDEVSHASSARDLLAEFTEVVECIGMTPGDCCKIAVSKFLPDDDSTLLIEPGLVTLRYEGGTATGAIMVTLPIGVEAVVLRPGDIAQVRAVSDPTSGRSVAYLEKVDASSFTAAQNLITSA